MKHSFRILFYVKRKAPLRNGNLPIMARITLDGACVHLSTRLSVAPELWLTHSGCVAGRRAEAERINETLKQMRYRLEQCYEQLRESRSAVTPQMIKERYFGGPGSRELFLAFFARHNEDFFQMVGVNRSLSTYYKYRCVYRHLRTFVANRYGCADVTFEAVDREFLIAFHRFIAQQCGHKTNTVWVYLIALKHIIRQALDQGLLHRDPFAGYRFRSESVVRNCLTIEEINRLLRLELSGTRLGVIRDAFLFSCFTGLSYADLRALSPRHIHDENGALWIRIPRRKTGVDVCVRLFAVPHRLLARYGRPGEDRPIFELPGNRQCNLYLERIMIQAEIGRHVTFHCARHTFATTVTLSQGVAVETISKLLGHKDIRTTQLYAKVTHEHLSRELSQLSARLDLLCDLRSIEKGSGIPNLI